MILLKYLTNIYKTKNEPGFNNRAMLLTTEVKKEIIHVLEQLVYFILDVEPGKYDAVEIDGIPPTSRQKIMKDMKIIELLTDIIYYPFFNGFIDFDNLKEICPD